MRYAGVAGALLALLAAAAFAEPVTRTEANNGNLVMEDVPEIPAEIVDSLNRYQNVRGANLQGWQEDSSGVFVSTRFADVDQLHRVDSPGGARHQLTFYNEPIGGITTQPHGDGIIFTRDAGGSEFAQIFLLDPATGVATMLTDGESRNGAVTWDREGRRLAYQSTARNGASNDIWLMDPEDPEAAEIIVESQDGSWWGPAEFSARGNQLLATNYVSITDSSVHLVDLDSGSVTLLAGGPGNTSTNYPVAFDDSNGGYMVLASAVHFSDRLRAAVDIVGISSFVTFLENTQDYRRDLRRVEYGDERDPAMRAHLEKISPLNNVEKISVPMFVVQGENDPRVPVTEATQMVAALREQGNTVWYMNALNEGHGYRKKENRDIYQQATILFLQTYLVGKE
jgi:dipeptidyl aminopeptidase/acylaminoacyl peptidase